jgi:hypothetical protein
LCLSFWFVRCRVSNKKLVFALQVRKNFRVLPRQRTKSKEMKKLAYLVLFAALAMGGCAPSEEVVETQVLVLGGGTGGTAAGIQAARLGAQAIIVEPTPWLGGMLTAAGVSAIDGNHHLPAGIWGEFRQRLREHYGSTEALATGWVSHTQFEPKVGAQILASMAQAEEGLEVWLESSFQKIEREGQGWRVELLRQGQPVVVKAAVLIDGTDLGDVAAAVGAAYRLGMDARSDTGESIAPEQANDIIQDLTYAAILQDYGTGSTGHLLEAPPGYDPALFACSCQTLCQDPDEQPHPCETMLTYAKLPHEKYMINWPIYGNDIYLDIVAMEPAQRSAALEAAKLKTLQFIYFIQHELGFRHLGIASDEFPTADGLPLIPYHREGRRVHGRALLGLPHISDPYAAPQPLYRAGVAVGDYPIDHHHRERPDAPELDFPPVPSFSIPGGSLLPKDTPGLIMADKAISVTNIANGSTRLQPVILQVGQAAGALAALAVQAGCLPHEVAMRDWQQAILDYGGYLLPSYDLGPDHPHFQAFQRVAATGILRGVGEPYAWANRTWFHPDTTMAVGELWAALQEFAPGMDEPPAQPEASASLDQLAPLLVNLASVLRLPNAPTESAEHLLGYLEERWAAPPLALTDFDPERPLRRAEIAVLVDLLANPFRAKPVGFDGAWLPVR